MRRLFLGLVVVVFLSGCAQDRSLAGRWTGKVSIDTSGQSEADQFSGDIAKALSDSITMEFELKEDGSYREKVLFFEVEGRWQSKGGKLALNPEKVNGKDLSELADEKARSELGTPKVYEVKEGGQALVRRSPDGSYEEVFTRSVD